jgi:hypothetical protein
LFWDGHGLWRLDRPRLPRRRRRSRLSGAAEANGSAAAVTRAARRSL